MEKQYSGVSEYTLNLLTEIFLQDRENQYKLFYNSGHDISARLPRFDFPNVEIVATRYPNKIFNNIFQLIFHWPKIDQRLGVDLFFVPNIGFISLSSKGQAQGTAPTKKIITIHDLSFLRYQEFFSWKRRLWHRLINVKKIINNYDRIVSVSENTKRDLLELCGVPSEKIKVIYSGINSDYRVISKTENLSRFSEVQKKYALPEKFILFLGTIEPRKNIAGLIRAYNQFRKSNPDLSDYKLVLAGGKGWKVVKIIQEYEQSDFLDDIIWLDYVDSKDKVYLYNLAALFVYPSFYEGFGFPPLEAMACGVPVVTSNCSSLPEVVGEAGIMIAPSNPAEIAVAIQEVLTNQAYRDELVQRGFKQIRKFSWKNCAEEYLQLFQDLEK